VVPSRRRPRPWGDNQLCADAGPNVDPRRALRPRAAIFDPVALAQDACFQRNAKAFKPADKRRKPWTEASQPEFESAPSCGEAKRTPIRPAALPGSRNSETRETTKGSAELKFRIQSSPADSPSLSGFRVRSRKSPGFQPLCGPFRAAVVGRDAQSPAASGRAALVSLSGHIPVPQCCGCASRYRRRWPQAKSVASGGSDLGGALSSDRLKQSRAGSVDLARRAADASAPAACLPSSRVAGARQEWLG